MFLCRTRGTSEGTAQSRFRLSRPASHLHCAFKLNPVEPPRYVNRMPGGVERGGAVRRPPIPIFVRFLTKNPALLFPIDGVWIARYARRALACSSDVWTQRCIA